MMKKRLFAFLLCIVLYACSVCEAQASSFRNTVSYFRSSASFDFTLHAEVKKLPQFSDERTEQLNRLLKHITVRGTVDNQQSQASYLLDDNLLFSYIQLNGTDGKAAMIAPDQFHYYIVPAQSEEEQQDSQPKASRGLDELQRNISIFETLDALNSFICRLPLVFPDRTSSAKIQAQTFRDYGKAVRKTTVTLNGDELTEFVHDNADMFPYIVDYPDFKSIYFEGRQTFSLYLSEDDKLIMAVFSGRAGISEDDLRTVRLEWKTVRGESLEKDELQLRTPNSKGTKRNNLLLTYIWKKADDGSETVQWVSETDRADNGQRTRIFDEALLSFTDHAVSGTMSEKNVSGNTILYTEGILNASVPSHNSCDGSLEINHKLENNSKKDKIEKDRILIRFTLAPGSAAQVSSLQFETIKTGETEYADLLERIFANIIQEMLKLPKEDIVLFKEGIPDEMWKSVFPQGID